MVVSRYLVRSGAKIYGPICVQLFFATTHHIIVVGGLIIVIQCEINNLDQVSSMLKAITKMVANHQLLYFRNSQLKIPIFLFYKKIWWWLKLNSDKRKQIEKKKVFLNRSLIYNFWVIPTLSIAPFIKNSYNKLLHT